MIESFIAANRTARDAFIRALARYSNAEGVDFDNESVWERLSVAAPFILSKEPNIAVLKSLMESLEFKYEKEIDSELREAQTDELERKKSDRLLLGETRKAASV